jgi:hypothetical protein
MIAENSGKSVSDPLFLKHLLLKVKLIHSLFVSCSALNVMCQGLNCALVMFFMKAMKNVHIVSRIE